MRYGSFGKSHAFVDVEGSDKPHTGLDTVSPEVFLKIENCTLTLREGGAKLMDNVSANFGPGELCAILGPSGECLTLVIISFWALFFALFFGHDAHSHSSGFRLCRPLSFSHIATHSNSGVCLTRFREDDPTECRVG